MTARERYDAVLAGKAVDHLPRVPILMQYAAEHIGSNYGAFASDHRVLVEANRRCAADFGYDQLSAISDPYRETQGFGAVIAFPENAVPKCVAPPLADTTDLSTLATPDPHASERMRDRVDGVRGLAEAGGGRYSVMGWVEGPAAEGADLRGVSTFLMDLMADPDFACELMDRCLPVGIDFARAQVEAGADTIGIGDAIASQVSPDVYESLIQPREKRLVEAIQGMGARVRLHICGDITHLLPGIADLGVDILDLDHMVSPEGARRAVGPDVALAGNLDPVGAVAQGTPASIREGVRRCYAEAGDPFMVTAGCEIPSGTPEANLRALCEPVAPEA